jgi:hypothetical protein
MMFDLLFLKPRNLMKQTLLSVDIITRQIHALPNIFQGNPVKNECTGMSVYDYQYACVTVTCTEGFALSQTSRRVL